MTAPGDSPRTVYVASRRLDAQFTSRLVSQLDDRSPVATKYDDGRPSVVLKNIDLGCTEYGVPT